MTRQDFKKEMIFHLIMAVVWGIVIIIAVTHKSQITWVLGVTAIAYLALDELINVYFFWRKYHGTGISEV